MRTGVSSSLALGVLLIGACGPLLGLELPERRPPDEPDPSGGEAGASGTPGGASGAGTNGGSGAEGGRSGAGGTSGVGGNGGRGGSPSGGNTSGGNTNGGDSNGGAGGDEPDPGPGLGRPCDGTRDYACDAENPNIVLVCDEDSWKLFRSCRNDERCRVEGGECWTLSPNCVDLRPECYGTWHLLDCDRDPFNPPTILCPFGCEDGRCLPGGEDDLVIHPEVPNWTTGIRAWTNPVPVCFYGAEQHTALVEVVRDEALRTWGRLLNVEFDGWSECDAMEGAPRVEIEFLNDCRGRLASPLAFGGSSTSGEPSRFGICRTFEAPSGQILELAEREAVLRLVARHQLGHALGWADSPVADPPNAMKQAFHESSAGEFIITSALLRQPPLPSHKPSGTLVTTTGLCLSPAATGLQELPCSDPQSGRFDPIARDEVAVLVDPVRCLRHRGTGSSVLLESCTDQATAPGFGMIRARFSTPERCLMPFGGPAGRALVAAACAPVGDPTQAWWFEIVAVDAEKWSARLRFWATGDCLARSASPGSFEVPLLEPCDANVLPQQVFRLWVDGQITVGDGPPWGPGSNLCLNWDTPGGVVYLGACNIDRYWLSGALETPDGLAVTRVRNGATSEFRAMDLDPSGLPSDDQIFDFAF